jgi:hypothetical protein
VPGIQPRRSALTVLCQFRSCARSFRFGAGNPLGRLAGLAGGELCAISVLKCPAASQVVDARVIPLRLMEVRSDRRH